MTENEVVKLMWSSRNEREWTENQMKVEDAHDGLPDFWHDAIVRNGLYSEVHDRNNQAIGAMGWREADARPKPTSGWPKKAQPIPAISAI